MSASDKTRTLARIYFGYVGLMSYVLFMTLLIASLMVARNRVLDADVAQQATADWQTWIQEVEQKKDQSAPVDRVIPVTAEPPVVLLLRDMFPMCVTAAVLFGSVLFGSFWLLFRGVVFQGKMPGGGDGSRPE